MANTVKRLYAGSPATSTVTLYTTPASTKTIVKQIILANSNATDATISIMCGGEYLVPTVTVSGRNVITLDLSLVLEAGTVLQGWQNSAGAISVFISGVEVA